MSQFDNMARELFGVSGQEVKDSMSWAVLRAGKASVKTEDLMPREVDGKLGLCILFADGSWLHVQVMSEVELKQTVLGEVVSTILGEAVVAKAAASSATKAD